MTRNDFLINLTNAAEIGLAVPARETAGPGARQVAVAAVVSPEDPPGRDTGAGQVMMAVSIFTVQVSRYVMY